MRLSEIVKEEHNRGKVKSTLPLDDERKLLEAKKLYAKALHELNDISKSVKAGKSFEIDNLLQIVREFVDSLLSNRYLFLQGLYQKEASWNFAIHSISVAVVCYKIGLGFGYKRRSLNTLILAAFLHDLGMLTIPKELLDKPGKYTDEEYALVKNHSTETYKILKKLGDVYSKIADIVYQEHEKEDGSGYPRGLKGDEIHDFAKIIGLADIYSALIHARAHRQRQIPFEAVKKVIARYKGYYPRKLMKVMINELSVFPPGIYVKLNTGEMGRVTTTNRLAPLRPTVEILLDSERSFLEDTRQVDLSKHHLINITDTYFNIEEAND